MLRPSRVGKPVKKSTSWAKFILEMDAVGVDI
jgi:hypothetical protein